MLSAVDTWGHLQYFVKSCFAVATTSFCSVLMKDALRPGPPAN
jgi:hypothetical protein